MSQYQISLYLKLILGLPIPVPADSVSACPCGHVHDFHGYHRLNCKHHAGRANRAAHDLVQQALKRELRRLGLHVRQISARIGLAVAKTSFMRILGIPELPSPSSVPRSLLARNCPGPADSISSPVLPTDASTLASLPSSVSSPPPALSP